MPNLHRGEIEACLDGKPFRLCLTLSALAELEHTFGHEDMLALAERFQSGRLSARDAQRIIGAGLRGAGAEIADETVGLMQTDGGAAGFVDIVARLLSATFGGPAAPIIGAVAGELISDLTGGIKSTPTETLGVRPVLPEAGTADVSDTMTPSGVRPSGSDIIAPTPNIAAGPSRPTTGAARSTSHHGVRPGGSDTVPFPGPT
jgi:hypothetical protein